MRSKLAEQLKQEQRERFAAMTPAERVAMSQRLGDEWLASYMAAHNVDRSSAMNVLRRSHRAGRRPSRSMDGDSAS
jgi:hypothetical protein